MLQIDIHLYTKRFSILERITQLCTDENNRIFDIAARVHIIHVHIENYFLSDKMFTVGENSLDLTTISDVGLSHENVNRCCKD